jgi:uncharacterized cupin superfamily protein
MTKKPKGSQANPTSNLPDPRPNVPIHSGEETFITWGEGERFGGREILLSRLGGAEQIHVNQVVLPAGKQAFPFHYHHQEEEHFYILAGRCVMRSGDNRYEMTAGDYVCCPAGNGIAHAFENPFDEDCTMLSIGRWDDNEICVYPDSGKVKVRALHATLRLPEESLDYWDGERADEPIDRG